jgi:hypothetical protein
MFSMLAAQFANRLCRDLPWNKARISCLALMLVSILRNRTVNLVKLSSEASDGTRPGSLYRRLQNFFLHFAMPLEDVGKLVLSRVPKPEAGWVLSMDRTNWKFGRKHINILVVAAVVNKVAVPIVWMVLPRATKRGNSNAGQRIALMVRLLRVLPAREIRALAMDREFIGARWLRWLDGQGVRYVVRIKNNALVDGTRACLRRRPRQLSAPRRRQVFELDLLFSGCRIKGRGRRDEFVYVVSNHFHGREATRIYRMRWGIEQVFGHLKKRGFDLESTHMADGQKIEKLFGVVTLAFLVSYGWGCEMRSGGQLAAFEKRKSIFRLGLDRITQLFSNWNAFPREIDALLQWLSRPKFASFFVV